MIFTYLHTYIAKHRKLEHENYIENIHIFIS